MLDKKTVNKIRAEYLYGKSIAEIATKFDLSYNCCYDIVNNISYVSCSYNPNDRKTLTTRDKAMMSFALMNEGYSYKVVYDKLNELLGKGNVPEISTIRKALTKLNIKGNL